MADYQYQQMQSEMQQFNDLVAKYQCNPTGKLSSFEAIRNYIETSRRLCNDNYDWAKRLEYRLSALQQSHDRLLGALKESLALGSIGYHIGDADVRGYDKIGERWGKKQDELEARIRAAIAEATPQEKKI